MSDKPREYCGIYGIYNHPDAAVHTYYGLHALQHRGQESAGIVTSYFDEEKERFAMPAYKDFGLVLNVFSKSKVFNKILKGNNAIGHNRYSTSGSSKNPANIQPFRVHYRNGNLAIGHNGNLSNAKQIRERFRKEGVLFQSTSDTELILHLISHSLYEDQMDQIMDALRQIEGAYCLVILTDDINDAEYIRDVKPGEVVVIDKEAAETGEPKSFFIPPTQGTGTSQCIFEYVYFSRPDSMIFGEMVDKIRRNLGKRLAKEHPLSEIIKNDTSGKRPVVISVPDSSNTAALGYATESQKLGHDCQYDMGLIRNHYVGRTFISPGQKSREQKVRTKFNPVRGVLEGRPVIIVDDSIVRGTTSRYLVDMIRECNPSEVHFLVSSPPIISPCYYGMDFPSPDELIANKFDRNIEKMAKEIGVESLRYLSADGLVDAVKESNPSENDYCTACFTGNYPVPVNFGVEKEANELI